ncbi:MAG: GTPase ObgE [Spirochaetales bacterium]|nr:GTPase ObgE [Spirochaetales bacterium]
MNGFVDQVVIHVSSGHGGAGSVSFRREKYIPKGGPDGGDGGKGGNVLFEVRRNLKTLTHLRNLAHYMAQNGLPGSGRQRHGSDGNDVIIPVPPGTLIKDRETDEVLLDLLEEGTYRFLEGGIGGKGNTHFATSRNQAPRFSQEGMEGHERDLRVELQLIADIGFVGLPNAGKSSLLQSLTAANPKVAAYPFTTKIPNLGVASIHNTEFILADIPGIIEGASQGAGLGLRFLKHIARTKALGFVIDVSEEADPEAVFEQLKSELSQYDPELLEKPRIILLNKIDLPEAREKAKEIMKNGFKGEKVLGFSAFARIHLPEVLQGFFELLDPNSQPATFGFAVPEWITKASNEPD